MNISSHEKQAIVAFLGTLTDVDHDHQSGVLRSIQDKIINEESLSYSTSRQLPDGCLCTDGRGYRSAEKIYAPGGSSGQ